MAEGAILGAIAAAVTVAAFAGGAAYTYSQFEKKVDDLAAQVKEGRASGGGGLQGPPGPRGERGQQGPKGEQGDTGPAGEPANIKPLLQQFADLSARLMALEKKIAANPAHATTVASNAMQSATLVAPPPTPTVWQPGNCFPAMPGQRYAATIVVRKGSGALCWADGTIFYKNKSVHSGGVDASDASGSLAGGCSFGRACSWSVQKHAFKIYADRLASADDSEPITARLKIEMIPD
jgi:hypothetical protein